jgi:orotidine-5'-phosphate decarboxylase
LSVEQNRDTCGYFCFTELTTTEIIRDSFASARDDKIKLKMTKPADKIIVALDVPSSKEARALLEQLRDRVGFFKIGLQLYTAEGAEIVRAVLSTGGKVFLDLKLHDIPNTVARAVESANALGVQMLTIHLSGGAEMVRAACDTKKSDMSILGVTVLTSSTDATLREVGINNPVDEQVLRLARLGVQNGVDGIVASAHEIKSLRAEFGHKIKIVVPGVRPIWAEAGDQKRTMTPREATDAGADYLVIGRPITAAGDPREALERILNEING